MTYLFLDTGAAERANEIIVDSFAGGGGASTGIFLALGRHPDVAVNHDPEAVAMHTLNHPATRHFCQNVWQVDPSDVAQGRPIGLAWFSPDCKHFSKAKGGKPVEKRIRDLAWVVVVYAKLPRHLRPRVIVLENVEEFTTWGPIAEEGCRHLSPAAAAGEGGCDHAAKCQPGRPCKARTSEEFNKWVGELRRLGYKVEYRELRACDYGAPTIRKRLFLIARCDGAPIVWPEPTHGAPDSPEVLAGQRKPWRTAAEIIDWSIPCPSIFLTKEEARAIGVKRPLEEATLRRIFAGLKRYVLEHPRPFIVPVTHAGDNRSHDSAEPVRTITTAKRGELAVVMPYVTGCGGRAGQSPPRPADAPIATMTAKADQIVCAPVLTQFRNGAVGQGVDDPLRTVTTGAAHEHVSTGVQFGVVAPTLIQTGYGEREGQAPRSLDIEKPLGTVVAGAVKHAVAAQWMVQQNTGVVGHDMEEPVSTIVGKGSTQMLAAAYLSNFYTSNTGGGEGGLDKPLKTVTAGGWHQAEVRAFLVKYYGEGGQDQDCRDPLHTIPTKARFGLVTVGGVDYAIADVGMRMLTPRELYRAQGFPDDYMIEFEHNGRPLPKSSQVRMCGNSVCPPIAAALVKANVPELSAVPMFEAAE